MANDWPEEAQQKILHATLQKGPLMLLATDMVEAAGFFVGNNICLSLICEDEEAITTYFDKLSQGGSIKYPLHHFYGGKLGGLVDQFGIHWMLKL